MITCVFAVMMIIPAFLFVLLDRPAVSDYGGKAYLATDAHHTFSLCSPVVTIGCGRYDVDLRKAFPVLRKQRDLNCTISWNDGSFVFEPGNIAAELERGGSRSRVSADTILTDCDRLLLHIDREAYALTFYRGGLPIGWN